MVLCLASNTIVAVAMTIITAAAVVIYFLFFFVLCVCGCVRAWNILFVFRWCIKTPPSKKKKRKEENTLLTQIVVLPRTRCLPGSVHKPCCTILSVDI